MEADRRGSFPIRSGGWECGRWRMADSVDALHELRLPGLVRSGQVMTCQLYHVVAQSF
jgi:hypothetical protein